MRRPTRIRSIRPALQHFVSLAARQSIRRTVRAMCVLTMAGVCLLAAPGTARAQMERLTDDEIRTLLGDVEHGADRFVSAIDDNIRRSIIRGPQGDVDVRRFLEDFEKQIETARKRFTSDYSAGAEVLALLRQASDIDRAMQAQWGRPAKSASEWDALAIRLRRLAENYGLPWPVDMTATGASRVNDRALRQTAADLERYAKGFGTELKKDKDLDKPIREATAKDAEEMGKAAKTLSKRIGDKKPATAEAREVLNRAARLADFSRREPLGSDARRAWSSVERNVDVIARAFGQRL